MNFKRSFLVAGIAVVLAVRPGAAQLRPLDPIDYEAFNGQPVRISLGGGMYDDQRASLAGTEGRLWEIGNVRVVIRTGRVLLDFGGTIQRLFTDEQVWAAPYGDAAAPSPDRRRHDAGDYRAATVIRLTGEGATLATLRFGTRLPTTDNRVGLDRDATDFFATLGARRRLKRVVLSGEGGLSINGTRKTTYEQSDVFIYALSAELQLFGVRPYATALGQEDFHTRILRGNEDLGEARIGVRAGVRRWIDAAWVHGYREFSPSNGVQLSAGMALGH